MCEGASQVVLIVKNLPANAGDGSDWGSNLSCEDPLEEGIATHSNILAWRIPWTENPGRLQSMGSQRVGHKWATNTYIHKHTHRSSSISGFPFVSYLFSQAIEGSRFLPSSVSWGWHLDSINTIWIVSYPETWTHLHLDCKIVSCSTLSASVTERNETDLSSQAS